MQHVNSLAQADTMFMAVELEAGTHDIRFQYVTPYIRYGIFISIGSCLIFLYLVLYNKIRQSKID